MKKLILSIIGLFLLSGSTLWAQNYSTDAILLSKTEHDATIRASGISSKKKEAPAMALKSALYTYMFMGIDGLNDNLPLLGNNPSPAAAEYANNILTSGRYSTFIKSSKEDEEGTKKVAGNYQAVLTIEIYASALYKDMERNGFAKQRADRMSTTQIEQQINLPTIMVVPFCASKSESFESVIRKNPDVRIAIAKVDEGFVSQKVQTKDLLQALANADTYQTRQGDMSLDDIIVNNSGADVVVTVDLSKNTTTDGMQITLILSAIEQANSRVIARKTSSSRRLNASTDVICSALAENMTKDFLKDVVAGMAGKIERGNSIALNFTIDQNSMLNMDSEVGSEMMPLSDVIIMWVKKQAKNRKYHQQGRSATILKLDEIQIENAENADINDFSMELYRFLRGLNLSIKRDIAGNTINITIQ